jgi:hypothetical protein
MLTARTIRFAEPTLLHASDFYRLELFLQVELFRVTRKERPFTSAEDVETACRPVQQMMDLNGRRGRVVLVDTRLAQGNNHRDFELWFAEHRRSMVRGFTRAAILTRSTIGKMQSDRLISADGNATLARVFCEESQAYDYLLAPPSAPSRK